MTNVTTEIKAIEVAIADMLLDDEGNELEVVAIKGRWVKLDDDRNISRAQAAEWRQAYLDENAEEEEEGDEEEEEGKMSETLRKYRQGYAKTTSYNGNHSLDNGDQVAELMRGMSPQEACALADKAFGEAEFHHWEKYQHLNPGSRRMNAGNRIRAAVRRGDLTIEQLKDAVAGKDITHDEADV